MRFFELKSRLNNFMVFSIEDIEKIEPSFHKQRLKEWQNKGYIKKIRQGFYIFSDIKITEETLFLAANIIYHPSYVSLEMALSLHGLIPESVYGITSVTSRKTSKFRTPIGNFAYRHIKPELMFGYELRAYEGRNYMIAEIEKALLDYFYLNPRVRDEKDFEGLRLNVDEFKARADMEKFKRYLEAFNSKALSARVNKFLKYINHA